MATHTLSADTLISTLMPSGGGTLASGDTIELSGHDLIIDADAVSYPVTLTNAGATAHLEFRDGGRIKLNATLPTSICPWVDPDNPLPESNYTAGLTANASAEIQLNGNFGLGGGPASLPTATRHGNWFARALSYPTTTTMVLDRDVAVSPGDEMVNYCDYHNTSSRVTAYNAETKTVTLATAFQNRVANSIVSVSGGGVCILTTGPTPVLSNSIKFGTLVVKMPVNGMLFGGNNYNRVCAIGERLTQCGQGQSGTFAQTAQTLKLNVSKLGIWFLTTDNANNLIPISGRVGELACVRFGSSDGQAIRRTGPVNLTVGRFVVGNVALNAFRGENRITLGEVLDFTASGGLAQGVVFSREDLDVTYLYEGTVSRVARTDFPVDTDLPDAFYHAPATAEDTTWRYEDFWVRRGETLRIAVRAMRGGDNGVARVAIGEMAVWVPAAGMPTLAEVTLDSGEPLQWRGGQIAWTNDTGGDCQVRVWQMGSGLNGAYIRTWKATGGAL